MSRPKARSTSPLVEILPEVFRNLEGLRPTQEKIQEIWERLAGKEASRHSWPRWLKGRRLLVEVENSGWMYNLRLKKEPLLRGLIELLGVSRVKELQFRMGGRKDA